MGRLRGFLWLMTGLIVAILAGFVGFVVLSRAEARAMGQQVEVPKAPVVVAARAIPIRAALTTDALTVKQVAVDAVPEGAAARVEDVEGQLTLVDLHPGEFVLSQRLLDPNIAATSGRNALAVAEDEVMMAFPTEDLMGRVNVLKAGDQIDLLFSLPFPDGDEAGIPEDEEQSGREEDKQVTFNLLQNMTISAVVAGRSSSGDDAASVPPEALLLTINPQDALVLKYVKDAGGTVDIVLRAPGAERSFTTEPVDIDYVINRYQIPAR